MSWFSDIYDRLTDYAKSKIRQLESFFSRGLGPQQANHLVKESSAISPENRKGVMPHEALQLWRAWNAGRKESLEGLPTLRSQWLRQSMAQPTHFRSEWGFRYLLDFSFSVRDVMTGEIREVTNTIGFRTLRRWGRVLDAIDERIQNLKQASEDYENVYELKGVVYVEGSIVIRGFYRTTVQ